MFELLFWIGIFEILAKTLIRNMISGADQGLLCTSGFVPHKGRSLFYKYL